MYDLIQLLVRSTVFELKVTFHHFIQSCLMPAFPTSSQFLLIRLGQLPQIEHPRKHKVLR